MTGEVDPAFWLGKRVLLTGHTGFKGSWLALWLHDLGASVHGLALDPPTDPSLFETARVHEVASSTIGDIRDLATVRAAFASAQPEIVIHMAAQPLVRESYVAPVETYATNVMGTVHVLECARDSPSVRVVVNVTSDKSYENREWPWGYRENEPMGGRDPYSSSKGCAELVTSAYRHSFLADRQVALASGRAGNVIGGGDWASGRLVPDILRAFEARSPVVIRYPDSIRPWQHVLEPLAGYLVLAQRLWSDGPDFAEAWNFGPNDDDARPVRWIVDRMVGLWPGSSGWSLDGGTHPHEAGFLKLDTSKARARLGWRPRWALAEALARIMDWHVAWLDGADMQAFCRQQIADYTAAPDEVDG